MRFDSIDPTRSLSIDTSFGDKQRASLDSENSFKDELIQAIKQVNQAEKESDLQTINLALDRETDLHDVMISAQKAGLMVETAVQVQKRAIDAYNEIMRMQI